MNGRWIFKSATAAWLALVCLAALNISVALADEAADPPGRVARLAFAEGAVSLQPAGVDDWADATLNRPLTTGDKLWTDQNSRAELDIGSAAIRLGSTTGVSFLNLDEQVAQLNVTAGVAIVHVRDVGQNINFEIDTPNVAVVLQSPGDYRVEVNDAGDSTVVKVSDGDAQVSASGQTVPLHTQQAYAFRGTDQVSADATSVGAPDALDSWSLDRDHRSEQAQAQTQQYVPPDMAGADDLAQYGTWQDTPDYGPVWTPTVAAGWSPYHDGRWVWVAPWGWTWVDAAPWGFAPFHYGRWAYVGTRWGWVLGPQRVRPVYAPALVAWVGAPGGSVTITAGGGPAVGWFPLGPREVYVPSYHVSPGYVRNVNVTNTVIVNNTYITNVYENRVTNITYVNRNRPGAVVAVSRDVFTNARPVSGHAVAIAPAELARFDARGAGPAIAPVRESVLGRRPDTAVRRPPAAFATRPVVARTAPPPAPVPFDRQQEAIRANGDRPLAAAQMSALQPRTPANQQRIRVITPVAPSVPQGGQRFGTARPEQPRPGSAAPSLQDRERTLHATPIPPGNNGNNSGGVPGSAGGVRADRPPQSQPQMRNDQYRLQNDENRRQAQEARPSFDRPQARPIETPKTDESTRPQFDRPQADRPQARPVEPARPVEQPRAIEPSRPVEQPRAQFRAPEPARPVERAPEQTRPEARPIEAPRAAAPAPQTRPSTPPPRAEERRPAPPQNKGDPRR